MTKRVYRCDALKGGTRVVHTVRGEDREFWHQEVADDGDEPGIYWMTYPDAIEHGDGVCSQGVDHSAESESAETEEAVDLTPLTDIAGIGSTTAQNLVDEFGSVAAVFVATQAELQAVSGVSLTIALAILAA